MRRVDRWDTALFQWASARIGQPFKWGETDCAMLALEAHDVVTGDALAPLYRGRWTSEREARRFMRQHDIDLLRRLRAAGSVDVVINFQQRGDLILAPQDGWMCGHVCLGARALSSCPDLGVNLIPTAAVLALPDVHVLRPA